MSVDSWTDDLASVVRYALTTARATAICPFHDNVTIRVGDDAAETHAYSAFAKTFWAFGRIDFAARLRWLLDLREPRAITGGANNFGQNFTRFFHSDQSLKENQELNSFARR
jgi:hypothetical protein